MVDQPRVAIAALQASRTSLTRPLTAHWAGWTRAADAACETWKVALHLRATKIVGR
jgi:hypothetical protein